MKIVFLDLDFTLLNSERKVTDKTLEVLNVFKSQGNIVAFATSRGVTNIKDLCDRVKPDVVISNGGATVHFKNQIIYNPHFSVEETKSLLYKFYKAFGDELEITIDTEDELYWNRNDESTKFYAPSAVYDDMKDFKKSGVKICIKTLDLEKVKKISNEVCETDCLRFSDIPWCKISPLKATKSEAVKYVGHYLNISVEDMYSFGDDYSDIGMLKVCGTGVAMANAIPEVKEVADAICKSCDEDGVACWIKENLLVKD